jgi:hypothetical protein
MASIIRVSLRPDTLTLSGTFVIGGGYVALARKSRLWHTSISTVR